MEDHKQAAKQYIIPPRMHRNPTIFWGGAQPPPQTPPPVGRGTPFPTSHPIGAFGASILPPVQ